jgi:hypothetical protein
LGQKEAARRWERVFFENFAEPEEPEVRFLAWDV